MDKKAFSKKLMLAAGILAAVVILCSQAFQKETCSFLTKIQKSRTEKPVEAEKTVIVATPSDAVTSGQAVEIGDASPSLIREIVFEQDQAPQNPALHKNILSYFIKTLFRVVISPQAP